MSLVLDSLEIKNFRAFKHLRIEKLGRVNLIVGKNNVGKSSVLEALWIYAEQAEPALLYRILARRDEIVLDESDERRISVNAQERASALNNLFFGRRDSKLPHNAIHIGSAVDIENTVRLNALSPPVVQSNGDVKSVSPQSLALLIQRGQGAWIKMSLDQNYLWGEHAIPIGYADYTRICVVSAAGLSPTDMAILWDDTVLLDLQHDVVAALQVIAPSTVSINFIGAKKGSLERIPIVKVQEFVLPVALRSLGEGMNRMLGIALALVNAKDGMLLIDEVDTGLHYSVLPNLWKLIFEVAHRLNVQVFATSHSKDCVEAFQQAADNNKDEDGILIRLEVQDGEVVPIIFDERKLNIATREQIEVR